MSQIKQTKQGLLKARCETDLALFYQNLATMKHCDTSDLVREALWEFKARAEQRMFTPKTHEAAIR